jgi:hypothetical protein
MPWGQFLTDVAQFIICVFVGIFVVAVSLSVFNTLNK